MGTLQPSVGGRPDPQPPPSRSFKEVLASTSSATVFDPPMQPTALHDHQTRSGSHRGSPAVFFKPTHIASLSQKFEWSLIGKFSKGYNKSNPKLGRPPVEDLTKYFAAFDFNGEFQIGLLDNRHLLIQLRDRSDYLRLYSRSVWYIRGMPMRIFKWTSSFHVDRESSIVPIWITLPRLPIHYFEKNALFSIVNLIGFPLRMDAATASLKRPGAARVQAEIDLLKDRPEKIWIGIEGADGFWQQITYDNVPSYCCHCWHVGHSEQMCHVHNPELKSSDALKQNLSGKNNGKKNGADLPPGGDPSAGTSNPTDAMVSNDDPAPTEGAGGNGVLPSPTIPVQNSDTPAENLQAVVQDTVTAPVVKDQTVHVPESPPLISHEIGFPPINVELSPDSDEEIEELPGDPQPSPILEVTAKPLYLSTEIQDDAILLERPARVRSIIHSAGSRRPDMGAHVSRELQLQDFRAFSRELQLLLPTRTTLVEPLQIQLTDVQPRKRGRPKKDLFLARQEPPLPSHAMVTRSFRSLSYDNLNDSNDILEY